jgi:tetratricopeptide (TPR) repeat protein
MCFRSIGLVVLLCIGLPGWSQTPSQPEPADAQGWLALATRQFQKHRFTEARNALLKAISLNAQFAEAYRALGETELELQNNDAAYRAWIEASKLNPKDSQTKYYLGRLFYEADFFNEAAAWFREVLALTPNHYRAMTYLGLSAEALEFEDTAVQLYRRAIDESIAESAPYSWAFLSLSKLMRKQGKPDQALKLLERAEQLCPEAHALSALGQLLAAEKQNTRAEKVLRRAIAMDPSLSEAHYRLSVLLRGMGQYSEAQVEVERFRQTKEIEALNKKITAFRK